MKSLTTILAVLAVSSSLALAADEKAAEKPAAEKAAGDKTAQKEEGPRRDPEAMFKKLDTNNDGSISKEEYLAGPFGKRDATRAEESFKKRDKDGNGSLSLEEFKAPREHEGGGDAKAGEHNKGEKKAEK